MLISYRHHVLGMFLFVLLITKYYTFIKLTVTSCTNSNTNM